MSRSAKLALRAYPPSFRARYGDELAALAEEMPESARTTADLFGGALRAWVRPHFGGPDGPRLRLQATVSTTWIAWCAAFMIVPALTKALLDPPGSSGVTAVRGLMDAATILFCVGWAIALAGLALIAVRVVAPAVRSQGRKVLGPLLPAAILAVVVALGLVALLVALALARTDSARPPAVLVWGFAGWLIALVAFLVCLGIGPAVSLRRIDAKIPTPRAAVFLSSALALVLTAMCACGLIAVLLGRDAALLNSVVPVIIVLVVGIIASVVALSSSTRGVIAARHH